MPVRGEMFVAGETVSRPGKGVRAFNAATGEAFGPTFGSATLADLENACAAAAASFDAFRHAPREVRAHLLDTIAAKVGALGDELLDLCVAETGLPRARLEIERGRTIRQLRMFADITRAGDYLGARIDPSQPERVPPRVDLRLRHIPLGPVAVFGSSNFPLAFSVAGGDTASALAAGAPVVTKAHPAHPGTSELVGRAIKEAVTESGLPPGIFSMIFDTGYDIGQALVADPRISAVAFTGSRRGGLALIEIARKRDVPVPVYAEMSSINPVILFKGALDERADAIARDFIGSLTIGAGQLCTNAGIVLAVEGAGLERFLETSAMLLSQSPAGTMLTPGIHEAYVAAVRQVEQHPAVQTISRGLQGSFFQGRAGLFSTSPEAFLSYHELQSEIFGAAALVVRCPDQRALRSVVEALEGQLTASIHIAAGDHPMAADIIPLLERKAGRIVVNGFATGVEVGHAMVHGGPYPSTSDSRSTSVGSLAIARFLRPVCYQDMPDELLPAELQQANPSGVRRMLDGHFAQ